jgi:hypothetical protein
MFLRPRLRSRQGSAVSGAPLSWSGSTRSKNWNSKSDSLRREPCSDNYSLLRDSTTPRTPSTTLAIRPKSTLSNVSSGV